MSRVATNLVLELIEEGVLDKDQVIMACVKYMSEDDVADMARINEFFDVNDLYGSQDDSYEYAEEALALSEMEEEY